MLKEINQYFLTKVATNGNEKYMNHEKNIKDLGYIYETHVLHDELQTLII
tara:strand:+ start:351 stop:500 length:150 start_codon:yes stop_codon:yes gene_type:complete